MDEALRADELATNESLGVLKSALFQALEADLSSAHWPSNSSVIMSTAESEIEHLMGLIKNG